MLEWISASIVNGLEPSRMPVITDASSAYLETLGVVMLNLGCSTVIPSWVNIKAMHVRTQSVMWTTVSSAALFYIIIGLFFALGFESNISNNSLQALLETGKPLLITKITVAMYSYVMLLPSVPVNFAISNNNLVQNKIFGKRISGILSFVVPLFICIPLQTRNYLFIFLTWTSLTFAACANFVIPLGIYLKALEFRKEFNTMRVLNAHQLELLIAIHSASHEIGNYISNQSQQLPPDAQDSFLNTTAIVLVPPTINIIDPSGNYAENDSFLGDSHLEECNSKRVRQESNSGGSYESHDNWLDVFRNRGLDEYSKISMKVQNPLYPTLDSVLRQETESSQNPVSDLSSVAQYQDSSSYKSSSSRAHRLSPQINDSWFDEDVPDPEAHLPILHSPVELDEYPNQGRVSMSSRESQQSLPRDPNFKAPTFRAVPNWMPIKSRNLGVGLLVMTSFVSISSIVLQMAIFTR